MANMRLDARFEAGLKTYRKDPIAKQAIRELQERLLHEGAQNAGYWDGIHYTADGQLELVQAYLGDSQITVLKSESIPKDTFDRLVREGHVLYDRKAKPAHA